MKGDRLYGLDGLRGLAALFVALLHLDRIYHDRWLFDRSYLLVDFFFMLSGFVLARAFEVKMSAGLSPWKFAWMRFRRVWAPVTVGSFLGGGMMLIGWVNFSTYLMYMAFAALLLPDFIIYFGTFPFNSPAWSIMFELFANVVHAVVLWRLRVRWLLVLALACALVLISSPFHGTLDIGAGKGFLYGFPRVIMSYSLGIAIWRILGDTARAPAWPALVGLPAFFIGYAVLVGPEYDWLDLPFSLVVCPLLLICGLGLRRDGRLAQICAVAGALSFPLYAVHYPMMQFVRFAGGPKWMALAFALGLAALVAVKLEKAPLLSRRGHPRPVLGDAAA